MTIWACHVVSVTYLPYFHIVLILRFDVYFFRCLLVWIGRGRKWIGGNWKCNNTLANVQSLVTALNNAGPFPLTSEVVIAMPALHMLTAKNSLRSDVYVAAEDVGINPAFGAYTGETCALHLVDAGIKWTLTGHSERRVGFGYPGETSDVVGKKTAIAIAAGLSVAACIGEQLAERENGQ